jgi:hypothetical protein
MMNGCDRSNGPYGSYYITVVSNHFHSVKCLLFSSARQHDFDEQIGRQLPVSIYTNATMTDKTAIDMWRFNVPELKNFLKCRGITCSLARKAGLVRLCELALELKLEVIAKDDYFDMDSSRKTVIDSDSQMTLRSQHVHQFIFAYCEFFCKNNIKTTMVHITLHSKLKIE